MKKIIKQLLRSDAKILSNNQVQCHLSLHNLKTQLVNHLGERFHLFSQTLLPEFLCDYPDDFYFSSPEVVELKHAMPTNAEMAEIMEELKPAYDPTMKLLDDNLLDDNFFRDFITMLGFPEVFCRNPMIIGRVKQLIQAAESRNTYPCVLECRKMLHIVYKILYPLVGFSSSIDKVVKRYNEYADAIRYKYYVLRVRESDIINLAKTYPDVFVYSQYNRCIGCIAIGDKRTEVLVDLMAYLFEVEMKSELSMSKFCEEYYEMTGDRITPDAMSYEVTKNRDSLPFTIYRDWFDGEWILQKKPEVVPCLTPTLKKENTDENSDKCETVMLISEILINERELKHGLYEITWKSGETSVAAIGSLANGEYWIAPCNWISVNLSKLRDNLSNIEHLEVIRLDA